MNDKIILSGSAYCDTAADKAYTVESGTLLTFLVPERQNGAGRKLLLAELHSGEQVPGLQYTDAEGVEWRFRLMSLDGETVLRAGSMTGEDSVSGTEKNAGEAGESARQSVIRAFSDRAGLHDVDRIGFEEAAAEAYRLSAVKDDAFLYQVKRDDARFRRDEALEIEQAIRGKSTTDLEHTRSRLYNAMAYIAHSRHFRLRPYEEIVHTCGRQFRVEDAARLSGFVARRVTLEDNWFHQDMGIFLAFLRSDGRAVICEPSGAERYHLVDPDSGKKTRVRRETADLLEDTGYVLYRPLPEKRLGRKELIRYALQELSWTDYAVYALGLLVSMLLGLMEAEAGRLLYDRIIPQGQAGALAMCAAALLGFSLSNILFKTVGGIASVRFTAAARYNIQASCYQRMLSLPLDAIHGGDSGDMAARVTGIADMVLQLVETAGTGLLTLVSGIAYLVRMTTYSPELSGAGVLMTLFYIALALVSTGVRVRYDRAKTGLQAEINSSMFQYLSGVEKIRLSGTENNVIYRYMRKFIRYKQLDYRSDRITILINTVSGTVGSLFTVVFFLLIAGQNRMISAGTYMGFSSAFGAFSAAALGLVNGLLVLRQLQPAWERARLILETLPENAGGRISPDRLTGEIAVEHVTFHYSGSEENVLQDLNIHIRPGEYVGIVGASGCGKSTLLKLLLGFEKADKGKIYYNGNDLDALDKQEVRKQIGTVLQDGSLIAGSIAENITVTAPGIGQDQIMETLVRVGLAEDVLKMPMGLGTMVSDENTTISGGQKQRILIARALVQKPAILLFDEATSALDNITQKTVCDTLESIPATRVVIAHRLSTVMHCDRILVLDHGKVAEEGSYEELMKRDGIFAQMAKRQIA